MFLFFFAANAMYMGGQEMRKVLERDNVTIEKNLEKVRKYQLMLLPLLPQRPLCLNCELIKWVKLLYTNFKDNLPFAAYILLRSHGPLVSHTVLSRHQMGLPPWRFETVWERIPPRLRPGRRQRSCPNGGRMDQWRFENMS